MLYIVLLLFIFMLLHSWLNKLIDWLIVQVQEEFHAIVDGPVKSLGPEWQQYKTAILKLASESSTTQHLLQEITDELDEGKCNG